MALPTILLIILIGLIIWSIAPFPVAARWHFVLWLFWLLWIITLLVWTGPIYHR